MLAGLSYMKRSSLLVRKMGTVLIKDLSPDRDLNQSLCNVNIFCMAQCF